MEEENVRHMRRLWLAIAREEARHVMMQRRILRGRMPAVSPWAAGMADGNGWTAAGYDPNGWAGSEGWGGMAWPDPGDWNGNDWQG